MSNYRRANTTGGTYFFTVVTYRRQNFLCNDAVRIALRARIQSVQQKHPFTIDGWVLPNHLHCIWTLPEDDADFGIRWAMIKCFGKVSGERCQSHCIVHSYPAKCKWVTPLLCQYSPLPEERRAFDVLS
jgi:hypothetical protein